MDSSLFKTPRSILNAYKDGLPGCTYDPESLDELLGAAKHPLFGAAAPTLYGSGKGKLSLPFKALLQFDTGFGPSEKQTEPDCTSHGTRNAVDITRAYEIVQGDKEDFFARGATEGIYGYRGHRGGGMSVSRSAKFMTTVGGLLVRKDYGVVDLSTYNGRLGARWGGSGPPKQLLEIARQNQVQTTSLITSIEEMRDALANGYAISIGSNQGFSSRRDQYGIAKPKGRWNHCHTADALIATPNGQKHINELQIGDQIFSHHGDVEEVTHVFERDYDGDIYTIQATGIPSFTVTSEHPILVSREVFDYSTKEIEEITDSSIVVIKKYKQKTRVRKFLWVDAEDIQTGDWLVTNPTKYQSSKFQPLDYGTISNRVKNVPKNINKPDSDIAWMFGLFIADGNTVINHKVSFTMNKVKDLPSIDRLKKAFGKLGLKITFKEFDTFYRAHCYSSVLANSFRKWFGVKSIGRTIPQFLIEQGWDINDVIEGIYDGDGFTHKGVKCISLSNKTLIYQLRELLINQGEQPTVFRQKRGKTSYKPCADHFYTLRFGPKKYHKTHKIGDSVCLPVTKITKETKQTKVYNLEVSGEHTYIAEGISSHNCMVVAAADDTGDRYNEILTLIVNSWGNFNSGPKVHGQPDGSFWVRQSVMESMIAQRQAFVFSNVDGFEARPLDWGLTEVFG